MNQKFALVLAGILTAFFIVMVGSIVTLMIVPPLVAQPSPPSSSVQAQPIQSQPSLSGQSNVAVSTLSTKIQSAQAVQIALGTLPRSTLVSPPELVSYQGIAAYEIKLDRATLYIDANTGKVLANSNTNTGLPQTTTSNRSGEHKDNEEKAHD
jgi:hypothetical protein